MSGKNIRSNCLFEREPFSFQLALSPVHENIIDPLLSVIFFHGDVIFVELRSENIIFLSAVVAGLMGGCDCPCRTYTTKRCVPTYKERWKNQSAIKTKYQYSDFPIKLTGTQIAFSPRTEVAFAKLRCRCEAVGFDDMKCTKHPAVVAKYVKVLSSSHRLNISSHHQA